MTELVLLHFERFDIGLYYPPVSHITNRARPEVLP